MFSNMIATVLRAELWAFVLGLVVIVTYRLLTGQIQMRRLLYDKKGGGGGELSPVRVQLLISTLATAAYYVSKLKTNSQQLPNLSSPEIWGLLGTSHAFYLGKKFTSTSRER